MASLVATTVTGELTVGSPGKIIFSSSSNIYLQSGTDSIALKASSGTVLWNSTNQVPASGGTFTGNVTISKSVPKLTFVNTAASNKTWDLQIDGTTFDISENGVADRLTIAAGGNATFTSNVFRVQSASSTDMLVRINSGSSEVDSRLMLGEGDTYGMTFEYDGVANIGYLGMNDNVAPTGAWSKRIQMTRAGTEVAFMAGSVGIGTNAPSEVLEVKGNITIRGETNNRLKIANDSNNNWAEIGNDGATGENTLEFFTGSSSTSSLSLTNGGYAAFAYASQVRLTLGSTGTAGTNNANWIRSNGANLEFNAASGDFNWEVGGSHKMRLTDSGVLGVGLGAGTDPFGTIHANGTNGGIFQLTRTSGGTTSTLGIVRFGNTNIDSNLINIEGIQDGATDSGRLEFQTQPTGGATVTRMTIKGSGLVGIGTTNPTASDWNASAKLLEIFQNDTNGSILKVRSSNTNSFWAAGNAHLQMGTISSHPIKIYTGATQRATILAGGSIGIGTTLPYRNAHIYVAPNSDNFEGALQTGGTSAALGGYFGYNSTSSGRLTISSLNNAGGANAKIYLGFGLDGDGSPATEVMTLNQDGNVGIGSNAPPTKFHVLGNTGHTQVVNIKSTLTTGGCYMQFTNATADLGYFGWGSTGNNDCYIVNNGGSNTGAIKLYAGSSTKLQVNSNGSISTSSLSTAHITCGSGSTNGGPFLRKHYSDPHYVNVLSSHYSNGNTCIGYGAAGKEGSSGYVATYGNFSGNKSILELAGQTLTFKCTASAAQNTVGDTITLVNKFVVTNSDVSTTVNFKIPQGNLFYLDGGSNTYIYSDTSDSIALATNSGVRMTLNNSGVGINVAPDGGLKIKSTGDGVNVLNMVDSAGDAMFNVRQSSNDCLIRAYKDGGSQKVQIHTDGDSYLIGGALGIGTSGPETRLHVEGSSFADAQVKIERSGSGQDEDPALTFSKSSSASDGQRLGGIYFGHSGTNYCMIRGEMSGSTGGRLYIITASQTNPLSNSAVETVTIEEGTITVDGAFRPRVDSSYTLGQTSLRWSHLYVDAITCGGAISGTGASITTLSATNLSSGTVNVNRLGSSGTRSSSTFLRGDNTWATPSGGGGGSGTVNSGDSGEFAFYSSTGTAVTGTDIFTVENAGDYEVNIGNGSTKGELCIKGSAGQTSTTYPLYVNGSIKANGFYDKGNTSYYFYPSSYLSCQVFGALAMKDGSGTYTSGYGAIYSNSGSMPYWYTGSGTNYSIYTSSDYRLKTNVVPWDVSSASTLVKSLSVYTFDWNEKGKDPGIALTNDTSRVGFLAHEVKETVPYNRLVPEDKDAVNEEGKPIYQTVDQAGMIPILWAALQDALKRIEELESKVN